MTAIRIVKKYNNLELISKIMNSVAVKYGCRVKYNTEKKSVYFLGDENCKPLIVEETANLFAKAA
jgi:hypothetical protein